MALPELQTMETVVLFADISGFTMISEACAAMGVRGNEELAFCINRYMEGMVKALGKYGGDIIKFVGDAMIVMWPRNIPANSDKQVSTNAAIQGDDKVTVIRKAIQCALDIQNEFNNKKIMSNVTNLSVKIGIGFGDCALLYVGGVFNRAEFFTVGEALTQALSSEEHATAGGQIIVSQKAWSLVNQFFESDQIGEEGKCFYKIKGMIQGIKSRADAVLLRNLFIADNFSRIQSKLRACVPAAIMPYLEIGYEQYGSETRRLTVMFASLGIDLSSAKTKEGMIKIQKIVTTVQQQVYRLEGSLNKLVMDDKGSTLICIWGLCPFSHEDDAARAILTAMNIRRELLKIDKTWCNVGISTGEVFSGVVGTSGSRKEFSVLGDYVNLAARIMYWPKKKGNKGKIHVDLQTKKEAENFITFNYMGHQEFKGKSISLPIFEPIDPVDEAMVCRDKIVGFDTFLKIHSNPFIVDRNNEIKRKFAKMVGRESLLKQVCEDDLLEYFELEGDQNDKPYILAVQGEIGSGKTLFGRCIVEFLKKRKDFLRDQSLGSDQKPILTSSLNAESQMKFLNIWRPILQMMLYTIMKRSKGRSRVDEILHSILKSKNINVKDENYLIIQDIFGSTMIGQYGEIIQLPYIQDPIQFVKRERYPEEIVDSILDFIIDFIKVAIGDYEEDDYSEEFLSQNNNNKGSNPLGNYLGCPFLMILDTVSLMDEASWRLLELIKDECTQIAIILLMQTDTNNQPQIHSEARQFYDETFATNNINQMKIIDLPPFKVEDLSLLITDVVSKYQDSMAQEIQLMTKIDDVYSIKNPEVCRLKEKQLRQQHFIQDHYFTKISDIVLKLVLTRCEGNPMTSMNFLFNLIANDYLVQKGNILEPSDKFMKCQKRCDWTMVPAAGISLKINCTLLDGFLKELRSRPNKADKESSVKGLLLLKCAAVVGDVFGSRVLQHISPLRHETHAQIMHILKILESKDLIEILDETDSKNAICRFRKSFLRETIYQIMLYRGQKKGIHQLLVEHIQDNPNSIDNDPEIEAEKLLWHILLAEDLQSEDQIPLKLKQGYIVKQIANMILNNPNVTVKKGLLYKQGNKPNRKVESRLMILKAKTLSWYHDEKEYQQGKRPLGVIYMQAIYHCVPAKTLKPTDDLNIGTCAWMKKDVEKEGKREFIFGTDNQNVRDEWISYIEFLRTKAIYDSFVNKYCNITFPLRRQSEEVVGESKADLLKQIADFGYKFRSQARIKDEHNTTTNSHHRTSSMKRQQIQGKPSTSFSTNNISQILDQSQANSQIDLAQKISSLFNVCIVSYVNQVTQNANKYAPSSTRQETLRKIPEALRNSKLLQQINNDEFQQLLVKQQSLFQGNQSHNENITRTSRLDKIRDNRRMSEAARDKMAREDSQDVVRIAEEMRSAETSPPERKPDSNGGFSSDQINQNMLAQRKSSLSNFTAKSQPQPHTTHQSQFHTSNSDLSAPVPQNSIENIEDNNSIQKQEQNKKSRISVQIELMNQFSKQRTLTFQKEGNNEDSRQVFTIPSADRGHRKSIAMEKIEEKEEYDRRGSGNSAEAANNKRQKGKYELVESSSSEEEMKGSESDENDRRTGKFSQLDGTSSQHNYQQNNNRQKEELPKQKDTDNHRRHNEKIIMPSKAKEVIEQDLTQLISQTIKDQVSKGLQEILHSVTQLTRQNRKKNNIDTSSLQTFQSNSSSDYHSIVKLRNQYGASSSKKVKLEQAVSKGQVTRQQLAVQEEEDMVESPDMSDNEQQNTQARPQILINQFRQSAPIYDDNNTRQRFAVGIKQKSPDIRKQTLDHVQTELQYQSVQNHKIIVPNNQSSRQMIKQNQSFVSQQQYPHPSQNMQGPLSQKPGQYIMSPQVNNGFFNNYQVKPQLIQPQQVYIPPFQNYPYLNQSNQPLHSSNTADEDSLFNFEDHPSFYQRPPQHLPHTELSSIYIEQNSIEENPMIQWAVVMEDIETHTATITGEDHHNLLMQLYEGDKVEVVQISEGAGRQELAYCKFENLIGLFPLAALKLLRRQGGLMKVTKDLVQERKSKLKLNERKKKRLNGVE